MVLGCRSLQLEVEGAAKALAQRQSPSAIDAAAERRMNNELHAAGFVEKTLEPPSIQRRQRAERRPTRAEVLHDLTCRGLVEPHALHQPLERRRRIQPKALLDLLAQIRNRSRQLHAPSRRFTQPKRNRRWLSVCILHAHGAALHAQNAIRRVAELKNFAL